MNKEHHIPELARVAIDGLMQNNLIAPVAGEPGLNPEDGLASLNWKGHKFLIRFEGKSVTGGQVVPGIARLRIVIGSRDVSIVNELAPSMETVESGCDGFVEAMVGYTGTEFVMSEDFTAYLSPGLQKLLDDLPEIQGSDPVRPGLMTGLPWLDFA